jgi:hypothetical protein
MTARPEHRANAHRSEPGGSKCPESVPCSIRWLWSTIPSENATTNEDAKPRPARTPTHPHIRSGPVRAEQRSRTYRSRSASRPRTPGTADPGLPNSRLGLGSPGASSTRRDQPTARSAARQESPPEPALPTAPLPNRVIRLSRGSPGQPPRHPANSVVSEAGGDRRATAQCRIRAPWGAAGAWTRRVARPRRAPGR